MKKTKHEDNERYKGIPVPEKGTIRKIAEPRGK